MSPKLFAAVYDLVMQWAEHGRLSEWRRSIVRPARGLVLEIAAGTGLDFPYYAPDACVVATDPDLAMLERSMERAAAAAAPILLVAADAERLPFRARTFDAAVVGLALCTIPRPDHALGELGRVLRAGASVGLLEHVRVDHPAIGRAQDWLTPLWQRMAGGCRLNRRTLQTVAASGLVIDRATEHAGGAVVEIVAHVRSIHDTPRAEDMVVTSPA